MRNRWLLTAKWSVYVMLSWFVLWSITQQLKIPDPISWSWFPVIKNLQAGIGAAFGLIAILLGALTNACLVRRRDDRLQKDHAKSLAASLAGEVEALLVHETQLLTALKYEWKNPQTNEAFFRRVEPMLVVPRNVKVFDAMISQIGQLPPDLARNTVSFYAFFDRAEKAAPFIFGPDMAEKETLEQFDEVYSKIKGRVKKGETLVQDLTQFTSAEDGKNI